MEIKLPLNTIQRGDCINILKTFPDNSIDLIFADPPYNMQTEGELLRTDGTVFSGVTDHWDKFNSLADYDQFCKIWLRECQRILKPNGTIWVIGSFQNIYRIGSIMQDFGFWILNDIVWAKPNAVPNFAGTRFQNAHETLLWCAKTKKAKYTFNYKTMKFLNGDKQMKSIWDIGICIGNERLKDENGQKVHTTQKPEKLLYNIIISSSKPNDIILDPFFGTGTTGAVAKKLGRHFIGIEREELYIKHAQKRIADVVPEISGITNLEYEQKPPKISMQKLIENGFLSIGQEIYSKNQKFSAVICENGHVRFGERTDSIHKISAQMLGKSNHNGWDFFWCFYNGKFISINALRYIANEREAQ